MPKKKEIKMLRKALNEMEQLIVSRIQIIQQPLTFQVQIFPQETPRSSIGDLKSQFDQAQERHRKSKKRTR
ncbi:hypothetical protein BT63DRAFT_426633 [Microthyrium microscopicum]|uniref:Uncharacterized protein n=1 Tax=Microthyrium microscopicum TaxID=703497 RepID=A0A6A6U816_9PEZI|nr:hypothetical protein BT63DRAFT_426633 [Microthyrium microscopicum]